MWPFSKKKTLLEAGIFNECIDFHSHILPGVDDGVRSMEDALQVLEYYDRIGIRSVWLTPHIMEDVPNRTEDLRLRFEELQKEYKGPIELRLSAENMLDTLFMERLDAGDLLPIGKEYDHLLVETSYFNPPMDMYGILDSIKSKGYRPVLAHPERYVYMSGSDYKRLKDMGVILQLNIMSLTGTYGTTAKAKAESLLKSGMYGIYGTDIHSLKSFRHFISTIKIKIPEALPRMEI